MTHIRNSSETSREIDEEDEYAAMSDEELIAQCAESKRIYYSQEYQDSLMERTRAAVCFLNADIGAHRRGMDVYGFLSLFHPEMTHAQKRELTNDVVKERTHS